jgi:ClpP class serine protease
MKTPTTTYVLGKMASAAYFVGSAADEVYMSKMSGVGSIGVYTMLVSQERKMKDEGYDVRVVRSTPLKGKGNPAEPIDEEAVKVFQEGVDAMHNVFVEEVALNRKKDKEYVLENMADGKMKYGDEAVEEGFVDGVKSLSEVMKDFDYDEEAQGTHQEQMTAHLEEQYSSLTARYEAVLEDRRQKIERIEELETELAEQEAEQLEDRVEQLVTQAVEVDKKVKPSKREQLAERARDDFEGTKAMLDMMESGSAGPSEALETEEAGETVTDTEQSRMELARKSGIIVATEDEAEYYETQRNMEEGRDFVIDTKLAEYDDEVFA